MAGCQLKDYREDRECPGRVTIDEDGSEEYVVERLVTKKKMDGIWKYYVKWYGWPSHYNTWEPASNLTHCHEKIEEFEREWKKKQRKGPAKKKSSQKNGEPQRVKHNDEGEPGEATTAGTNGQEDVNVKEDMDACNAGQEEHEEKLFGYEEETAELDRMWLGSSYEMFRRKWKPTEEPVCVLASAIVNGALLHLVQIRCPTDPEHITVPEEEVDPKNMVLVLSRMLRETFPQILIQYYESRLMLLEHLKSDENLVRDAARAGLVHNLLGAKVDANYRKIYKDMMPAGQGDDNSDDDKNDLVPDELPVVKEEPKKKLVVKEEKDAYGLPYYYGGEGEGTFGSDDEGSSDDSDEWEEVKTLAKGQPKRLKKKKGAKE